MVGVAPHLHAAMRAALRAHLRCLNFDLFSGSLARRRVISPRLNASKRKANFFITAWKKTGSRWDACSYRALPPTESHDRSTTLCRPQAIHHLCVWKWWAYTRWQARTHTCMHARTRTQAASRHARTHSHAYNDSHALTRAHPHFFLEHTHTWTWTEHKSSIPIMLPNVTTIKFRTMNAPNVVSAPNISPSGT